jgi:hypothetical protein
MTKIIRRHTFALIDDSPVIKVRDTPRVLLASPQVPHRQRAGAVAPAAHVEPPVGHRQRVAAHVALHLKAKA